MLLNFLIDTEIVRQSSLNPILPRIDIEGVSQSWVNAFLPRIYTEGVSQSWLNPVLPRIDTEGVRQSSLNPVLPRIDIEGVSQSLRRFEKTFADEFSGEFKVFGLQFGRSDTRRRRMYGSVPLLGESGRECGMRWKESGRWNERGNGCGSLSGRGSGG